ncbi:MAG: hypothetical protein RL308_346 [Bacteroidota bacterium]|jgi:hypothetical protein
MKKLIILSFFLISTNLTYSQFISYEYTQTLIYSLEITYSSSNGSYQPWSPDLNFYGNALAEMQARYDRNHSILSKEYFKLKDLKLINSTNLSTLNNYRAARLTWIYNSISSWDLGNESNTANIRNYCCEIYSNSSIRNEITLLQSCQNELNRIKSKDPDNFLYSKRYQSIMKTLDKLKNCSTSAIEGLSWEATELEDQNSSNQSTTNYSSNSNQTYSTSIIGKPIKIGNIEVAENNFPKYLNWNDAKKACSDLGIGWRLPTKVELWNMYLNRDKIGGSANNYYWSSTEYAGTEYRDYVYGTYNYAYAVNFKTNILYDTAKTGNLCVRAVRSF